MLRAIAVGARCAVRRLRSEVTPVKSPPGAQAEVAALARESAPFGGATRLAMRRDAAHMGSLRGAAAYHAVGLRRRTCGATWSAQRGRAARPARRDERRRGATLQLMWKRGASARLPASVMACRRRRRGCGAPPAVIRSGGSSSRFCGEAWSESGRRGDKVRARLRGTPAASSEVRRLVFARLRSPLRERAQA